MNEIGNLTEAMTADTPRQRMACPDCPVSYTSEVNLRAHQYRMHQKANLGLASTRDLLEELAVRFEVTTPYPLRAEKLRNMLDQLPRKDLDYRTVGQ